MLYTITALFIVIFLIFSKLSKERQSINSMTTASVLIILSVLLGQIRLFEAPLGGNVSPFTMLPIALMGYFFGGYIGILSGIVYGLLRILLNAPIVWHPVQIIFDYPLAFAALGMSGFFNNTKFGLYAGYISGVLFRFTIATISTILFFSDLTPNGWNFALWAAAYNISYIGIEALATIIIICIPAFANLISGIHNRL